MRVKIGDQIYDAVDMPIMVILDDFDKRNLISMDPDATKYACFPDSASLSESEKDAWMDDC